MDVTARPPISTRQVMLLFLAAFGRRGPGSDGSVAGHRVRPGQWARPCRLVERVKVRSRYSLVSVADGALRWPLDFAPSEAQMLGPWVADRTVLIATGDTLHAVVVE